MSEKMNNNVGDMNPEEADKATVSAIETLAKGSPQRSLKNVRPFRKRIGYLELGDKEKTRTLSVNTVKTFAQSLKMMGLSKELVKTNDFATKRDAYYQSKNWGTAAFKDQPESDTVMDDIEAMMSRFGLGREHLRYVPDEHGGSVAGALKVHDKDLETGEPEIIGALKPTRTLFYALKPPVCSSVCRATSSGANAIASWFRSVASRRALAVGLCVDSASRPTFRSTPLSIATLMESPTSIGL
jgi:hypothetical protein